VAEDVHQLFKGVDLSKLEEQLEMLEEKIAKANKQIQDGVFKFRDLVAESQKLEDTLARIDATVEVMGDKYDPVNARVDAYRQNMIEVLLLTQDQRDEVERLSRRLENWPDISLIGDPAEREKSIKAREGIESSLKAARDSVQQGAQDFEKAKGKLAIFEQEQEIKQVFQAVSDSITGSINQMVRGVLQGTQSISDAFANMAENIVLSLTSDLLQSAIRGFMKQLGALAAQSAASGFGGLFGDGAAGGGVHSPAPGGDIASFQGGGFNPGIPSPTLRAAGGPLGAGQLAVVGEKGPELFMSRSPGTVIPNKAFGNTMTVNIINNGKSEVETQERTDPLGGRTLDVIISDVIAQDAQNNGRAIQSILGASGLRRTPGRR
jgi:predicted DNA-binding protein YlxM (UPF0122 family)